MRRNLLIVSGSARVRESLAARLRGRGFTVTLVATGPEALQVVKHVSLDAVLLECRDDTPAMQRLRDEIRRERPGCRVAVVSNLGGSRNPLELLRLGDDDYVVGVDQLLDLMRAADETGGSTVPSPLADKAVRALTQVVDVLVGLLELDDRFFRGSSHRAMRLARPVAEELAQEQETVQEVVLAALLRDIGKAGVEVEVLEEQGEYSEEQASLMQEHVEASVRLLDHIDLPWKLIPAIRHHHERYDGRGYPSGLRGREIPLGARILAVADAYLSMTSDRPHRPSMEPGAALTEIERMAGTQFDPEVVEVFLRVVRQGAGRGRDGREAPAVLVAEPDRHFAKLLRMRLLNEGFEVVTAESIRRARKRLFRRPPALALISAEPDLRASLELLREVREHETLHHLPIALLAPTDDRIAKVRALRQGVDDFLVKDGDLDELVARVENIVSREQSRRKGAAQRRSGISGELENMPLPDIVQTLAMGMKTARVGLESSRGHGELWFREGKICHASVGKLEGEEAVFRMLGWREGEFLIQHGLTGDRETIDSDPMFVVLEGLRRLDDASAAEAS